LDLGLILSDIKNEEKFQISNFQTYETKIEERDEIFEIVFDASHYKAKYTINYLKLQEVLAIIGGIIQLLKIVFKFILSYFYKFDFYLKIFSEQYLNGDKYLRVDQMGNYITELEFIKLKKEKDKYEDKHKEENQYRNKDMNKNKNENHDMDKDKDKNKIQCEKIDEKKFDPKINFSQEEMLSNSKKININGKRLNLRKNESNKEKKITNLFRMNNNLNKEIENYNNDNKNDNDNNNDVNKKNYKFDKSNNNNLNLIDINKLDNSINNNNNFNLNYNHSKNENKNNLEENNNNNFSFNNKVNHNKISENASPKINQKNKLKKIKAYSISLSRFLYSKCLKDKFLLDPFNLIIKKISKEMRIGNFLKLKEDFYLFKNLIFQSKDNEIFKEFYEFPVIINSLENNIKNNEKGFYLFLRDSFNTKEEEKEISYYHNEDFLNKYSYLEKKFKL
jgi:hypothetical protein